MNTKSYNPFKMWGSYVIFGILISIYLLFSISGCHDLFQMFNLGGPNCYGVAFGFAQLLSIPMLPMVLLTENIYIAILIYIACGFLVGWGIHSLIRKVRN